ncbi:c-type cytochrome [Psychromonas aquimarina]|uniref:c-type cytochrome n=1 Tax=Psychromonas aquimarina TaxID=444919 RepID=UPI000412805B|nr:cytochrome c [Psychromonas aquimarina]
MKYFSGITLITLLFSPAWLYASQDFSSEIENRQAAFTAIEKYNEQIEEILDQSDSDWVLLEKRSAELVELSNSLTRLFPSGSAENSKAKENIWKNSDDFNKKLSVMQSHYSALEQGIKSKDKSAAEKALKQVNSTCRSCHRSYRSRW